MKKKKNIRFFFFIVKQSSESKFSCSFKHFTLFYVKLPQKNLLSFKKVNIVRSYLSCRKISWQVMEEEWNAGAKKERKGREKEKILFFFFAHICLSSFCYLLSLLLL